uniref:Uncharacterized protein n=1 Tax=Sphaeramia orbicularis TaxID=375764 RepID=A0A673C566_9TELE
KMYFEANPPANQFLGRAYLCQGQLKSPLATGSVVRTVNWTLICVYLFCMRFVSHRYHFLVFNASVLYFQTVRPLLQPGRCLHLIPSLTQVVQSLEEVADQDHMWRAELMMQLIKCLVDSGKMEEAGSFAKVTEEFIKSHTPHLYPQLFTLLVSSFFLIPVQVIARMKEIGKLDQWLQTAMREGDPEAMQAVCTTQWSFCLPLLQHNLRKHVKTALLRVAQALEDVQSTLLELRCQVHSELALIEEEEGRLEVSLTHLQRAMQLDNGTQQERLSLAFRLLQLRGTLYQTPSRAEDKAAMLMQQARDMQLQDKADSRPMLVAVGLLLAPDDFQMVLDADNPSQSREFSALHSIYYMTKYIYNALLSSPLRKTSQVKLWAALVKAARKQEVWDVCRAACRFCLLYDDGRWKDSKTNSEMIKELKTDGKTHISLKLCNK